jgi:hypothetical protein
VFTEAIFRYYISIRTDARTARQARDFKVAHLIFGWWRVLVNAPPFARFSQHNTEIVRIALKRYKPTTL